jgi:predicted AAA+ superfamily ATPase
MANIARALEAVLARHLARTSVLLLGPRQTGKTTLLHRVAPDLTVGLAAPSVRQRYERDPGALAGEVEALPRRRGRLPLVAIDEVQKVPALMDAAQDLIDRGRARFLLTGSSARRLRRGQDINLLPGRQVTLRMDPLSLGERLPASLDEALLYGSLPAVVTTARTADREADLASYVETYLEEEVRQEALVRNVGAFGRFLEMAAQDSGRIVNYSRVSQDVGVSSVTVQAYYDILVDCLVAERVEPITRSASRKKLTRASRFLLFDMGVRRLAAREGSRLLPARAGELFEHYVGLELIRLLRLHHPSARVRFWRDPDGPEVDWVVEHHGRYLPIEVKFTDRPSARDARHLDVFLDEYSSASGLVVCSAPRKTRLGPRVTAVPWQALTDCVLATLRRMR